MGSDDGVTLSFNPSRQPFFLDHLGRRLFAVYHLPADTTHGAGGAVYFGPFAEEMNRARRTASLLAEALSSSGTGTLLFDYAGTGDSDGAFAAFRWEDWIDDGVAAIKWLREKLGGPVTPVGLRLGAVLALECARQTPEDVARIVLWQPVTSGSAVLTQFLRTRVASSLSRAAARETTTGLRERLYAGETLQVAGYDISPDMARSLDSIKLAGSVPCSAHHLHWFEIVRDASEDLLPPSRPVIAAWRDAGVRVSASTVAGEPFWSTQETATAPALIEATVRALTGIGG